MKKNLMKWGVRGLAAVSAVSPLFALGQQGITQKTLPTSPVNSPADAINILCTIAGWMFTFLIVLAIIFVIYAALNYLTAGGETEKVTKANHMLIYAVVAIVVGLLAKGAPALIGGIVGSTFAAGC